MPPALDLNSQALAQCKIAKEHELTGDYHAAQEALAPFWQGVGEYPQLDGLNRFAAAEILLHTGILTMLLGSAEQLAGAQELAKDLITKSIRIFSDLGEQEKSTEAQFELARCYWREGSYNEARDLLRDVLGKVQDSDLKARALFQFAILERSTNRLNEALRILNEAAPLFNASASAFLKGGFHNELGITLKNLGASENNPEYIDRALMEFTAASFYWEQVGNARYQAAVENNLGLLYYNLKKYVEAHEHLERARQLFVSLKDEGHLGQLDETRAQVLLAQERNAEAEGAAQSSVNVMEKGDRQALLAESLTTHGISLARLGRYEEARVELERAIRSAEAVGDREGAGRAALSFCEELTEVITEEELREMYNNAEELLSASQHIGTLKRLLKLARRIVNASRVNTGKRNLAIAGKTEVSRIVREAAAPAIEDIINNLTASLRTQNPATLQATSKESNEDNILLPPEVRVYRPDDTISSFIGRVTKLRTRSEGYADILLLLGVC